MPSFPLHATRYSLLAMSPVLPSTSATVAEPERPNEKDSSMSSGFCLK